jgi:hypothetical protein
VAQVPFLLTFTNPHSQSVILSGVEASHRETSAQSKDLCILMAALRKRAKRNVT